MFQQNISTDDSVYYNRSQTRAMGRGKGGSRFRFSLRAGSVNGYVVTEEILKNLRATISQGKDKNFPSLLSSS